MQEELSELDTTEHKVEFVTFKDLVEQITGQQFDDIFSNIRDDFQYE